MPSSTDEAIQGSHVLHPDAVRHQQSSDRCPTPGPEELSISISISKLHPAISNIRPNLPLHKSLLPHLPTRQFPPNYLFTPFSRTTMADLDLQVIHDELVSIAYDAGAVILAANPASIDLDSKLNCASSRVQFAAQR